MDAHAIISGLLGGDHAAASAAGVAVNTVTYWRRRDSIPPEHWQALIDLAGSNAATVRDALIAHRATKRAAVSL